MQNKKFLRSERLSELIHKELAIIIVKFCQDPRLEKLTITNVKLSADLSIAKIYFTNFNNINTENLDQNNIKLVLKSLKNASNFFRNQLANKISLRKIPELKFFYDDNMVSGSKIEILLAKLGQDGK
jgi:ribosome-binding factor A